MRRTLLVAAIAAALMAPAQPVEACDITKLKAALTECAEFWSELYLLPMNGLCGLGYLGICYLF